MSDLIPMTGALPAYLQGANRKALAAINKDVVTAAQFPTLSIKGKVFTLVRDNEKKMLTKLDADSGEQVPIASIQLAVLRANKNARAYYEKGYTEGDSDGARPTCFSNDGKVPSDGSLTKQSATCATCPKAVWGTRMGDDGQPREGTECSVMTRLAVTPPDQIGVDGQAFLLRVPAGSRKAYADAVKAADARGIPYNALVFRMGFEMAASAPKLTFKPVGLLSDEDYTKASALYEDDLIKDIIGLGRVQEAVPALPATPASEMDELDAAIAARQAVQKAATVTTKDVDAIVTPAPAPAPAPRAKATVEAKPAPAPAPAPKAAPPAAAGMDDLLAGIDELLGGTDD